MLNKLLDPSCLLNSHETCLIVFDHGEKEAKPGCDERLSVARYADERLKADHP
jgi:hypothetical protein